MEFLATFLQLYPLPENFQPASPATCPVAYTGSYPLRHQLFNWILPVDEGDGSNDVLTLWSNKTSRCDDGTTFNCCKNGFWWLFAKKHPECMYQKNQRPELSNLDTGFIDQCWDKSFFMEKHFVSMKNKTDYDSRSNQVDYQTWFDALRIIIIRFWLYVPLPFIF